MANLVVFPTIDLKATGRRIESLRKAQGLSVRDLQTFFAFEHPQAIYKWQWGECLPSVDNLFALSRLLRTPIDNILVSTDQDVPFLSIIYGGKDETPAIGNDRGSDCVLVTLDSYQHALLLTRICQGLRRLEGQRLGEAGGRGISCADCIPDRRPGECKVLLGGLVSPKNWEQRRVGILDQLHIIKAPLGLRLVGWAQAGVDLAAVRAGHTLYRLEPGQGKGAATTRRGAFFCFHGFAASFGFAGWNLSFTFDRTASAGFHHTSGFALCSATHKPGCIRRLSGYSVAPFPREGIEEGIDPQRSSVRDGRLDYWNGMLPYFDGDRIGW